LVSTFYGLSEGAAESWMIVGDLSALYDLAAPWIAEQLSPGNRRIVIINNGGGKIFSRVESLRKLDDAARTLIENRHAIDFHPGLSCGAWTTDSWRSPKTWQACLRAM